MQISLNYTYIISLLSLPPLPTEVITEYQAESPVLYGSSHQLSILNTIVCIWVIPGDSAIKNLSAVQKRQEIQFWSLAQEDLLEKHSLQYSCREKSHGQRSLESIVHGVAKGFTWLKRLSTHTWCVYTYILMLLSAFVPLFSSLWVHKSVLYFWFSIISL